MHWRGRVSIGFVAVLALTGAVACSSDDDAETGAPTSTTAAPAAEDPDWPTAGQNLDNTRAAVGSVITSENVDELEESWRTDLPDAGTLSTVPLVVGDAVYIQGATGQISVLDRESGEVRWASELTGFNIGPFGAAVGDGLVYGVDGSTGVIAVDSQTGEEVWSTDITATDTTGVDIQPVVADGLVIAGSVPVSVSGIYTGGDRGVVTALDAESGEVAWTFDTVKGDDLWGNAEVNSGGGAWYPPVVDVDRGLVYVGVANPAPFPGTPEFPNGTSRPGDNLYTDSIVALSLETGELQWFHQVSPHDLFDRDQVHTLMAHADDGEVVISTGKSGVAVGLDPDEGDVLWETEVGVHENDDLEELEGPTFLSPGTYGGVLTPPSTADGVVYLATVDAATELPPDETAYFGAPLGTEDGEITAVDATTGDVLWETDVPGDPLGGTAVVNDLVFTALLDGTVVALDRETGDIASTFDAGGGINGWMSVVDDTLYVPVGNTAPPQLLALGLP